MLSNTLLSLKQRWITTPILILSLKLEVTTNPSSCPPSFSSSVELSTNFVSFFENKIVYVRSTASIPWCLLHLGYIWFNAQLSIGFTYFDCWIIERRSHHHVEVLYFGSSTCCFAERTHRRASTDPMYHCEPVSGIWPPASVILLKLLLKRIAVT